MRLFRLLKRDLHNEARTWVKQGLINEAQAESICREYGIDYYDQTQRSFGYYVLIALGYLFIGLAVITLIGENWDNIPRAVRMGGLIAMTLLANGIGIVAWQRKKPAAAVVWFLLGGLMYGASIMLIAQIYHIGEHYPDGIFWWALGVLPVALLLRSNLLMTLTAVLAYLWFFVEAYLDFYPAFFPVFLLALAWQNLRVKPNTFLFLVLMAGGLMLIEYSSAWILGGQAGFDFRPENVFIGAAMLAAFHGLAKWLGQRTEHHLVDYGVALQIWTLRGVILGLFVFSFEEPWHALLRATWDSTELNTGLLMVPSVIFSVLAIALAYLATRSVKKSASTLAFVLVYLVFLIAVLMSSVEYNLKWQLMALQVFDNVLLVAIGIGLIVQGIRGGVTHYFYLGVFTILLTGLLRYIDLVGDYIGAAMLFAVFALILLASARYWKNHVAKTGTTP